MQVWLHGESSPVFPQPNVNLFVPIRISAIKGYLKLDHDEYGAGVTDRTAPEEQNPWQQGIDDALDSWECSFLRVVNVQHPLIPTQRYPPLSLYTYYFL